jgi:hypothetical protein
VPELEDELTQLRRVPPRVVRRELDTMDASRSSVLAQLHNDLESGLERLTDLVLGYWELALEPHWPRLRALLEGDVLYRSRLLGEGSAELLFNDLAPMVRRQNGKLIVAQPPVSASPSLDGRGLVLVPSAFVAPRAFAESVRRDRPAPATGAAVSTAGCRHAVGARRGGRQ